MVHGIHDGFLHNRPESPGSCFAYDRSVRYFLQCIFRQRKTDAVHLKQLRILTDKGILGFLFKMRMRASSFGGRPGKQSALQPINSGIRPYLTKSWTRHFSGFPRHCVLFFSLFRAEMMDFVSIRVSIILSMPTKAPPQIKENIRCIDLDKLLLRMLSSALRSTGSWFPQRS